MIRVRKVSGHTPPRMARFLPYVSFANYYDLEQMGFRGSVINGDR
jgi:hypothetical protein